MYEMCIRDRYVQEFGIGEELLCYDQNGSVYAIEMRDNPIFTQLDSIETEGLFLAVRPLRPNDRTAWQKNNYENGLAMARYIISGGTAAVSYTHLISTKLFLS